jgi:sugar transferase (PEP-CTERM/EpsH1 system associated)
VKTAYATGADAPPGRAESPLIAHVVHRFDVGGLENGVVNLLNRLPRERFRHVVIALTEVTDFRRRVERSDVRFIALAKGPGQGAKLFPKLFRMFREIRPDIVHSRNLAALEAAFPAWLAGVPVRLHGEHGRDMGDLDGSNAKYRLVRKAYRPFVSHYVALSRDLERYLVEAIGVDASRVTRIVNGVDVQRFRPGTRERPASWPFDDAKLCVVGTVGRLQPVKNQALLAKAFVRALEIEPAMRARLRLAIVGEGPLRGEIERTLAAAHASELAWLPGARDDVAEVMRALDVFVLPSRAEGISNTLLEAMASGLPLIATNVGGNAELVTDDELGMLVPEGDAEAMARALLRYADTQNARSAGAAARRSAERLFGLDTMVASYAALYERLLAARTATHRNRRERLTAGSP